MGPHFHQIDRHTLDAERLHIRWRGFHANMIQALEGLFTQTCTPPDLWLVAADGTSIRAHRIVMAAASEVFKTVLLEQPEEPLIVLDNVIGQTLEDLVHYVYKGQVHLNPQRLGNLVSLGTSIGLKGIGQQQVSFKSFPQPEETGLSLLASAALESGQPDSPNSINSLNMRLSTSSSPFNDENDPPFNKPPLSPNPCAINLSLRNEPQTSSSLPDSKTALFPISPLLNIPDPANFKWRRYNEPRMAENREETPPPLAIDMSSAHPNNEPSMVTDLPATPSPSPCSVNSYFPTAETVTTTAPGVDETLRLTPEATKLVEGKKWKSRQPKLCIHCDRYFSNQFNLKQHILNMHTIGGDVRCDKCNKTVKNKWYLRRHQVTHHNAPLKK